MAIVDVPTRSNDLNASLRYFCCQYLQCSCLTGLRSDYNDGSNESLPSLSLRLVLVTSCSYQNQIYLTVIPSFAFEHALHITTVAFNYWA